MTVKEMLADSRYGVKPYWPYNETHVEIRERYPMPGEQPAFIMTEKEAVERFADRHVWLAFHDDGTFDDPVHGEHVFAICID